MLPVCSYLAVATQDESLIKHARDLAERARIGLDCIGFQMLCGVRPRLRLDPCARGLFGARRPPYGPEWYSYLMRRLAERPVNLLFILKNPLER